MSWSQIGKFGDIIRKTKRGNLRLKERMAMWRLVAVWSIRHTKVVRFLAHAKPAGPPSQLGIARISVNGDSDSIRIEPVSVVSIQIFLMARTLRSGHLARSIPRGADANTVDCSTQTAW